MKLKNVTKENIKLIEELELFVRKSQMIDFVEGLKSNKDISLFVEHYKRGTLEEKVNLHKLILQLLKDTYDKALFIQNNKVTRFFTILPVEELATLQGRYFKKGKPDDFDKNLHVFSSLPYILLKYDTEMDYLSTILIDYTYKANRDIQLELKKINKRVELHSQEKLKDKLSPEQSRYISEFNLNPYEVKQLIKKGFNQDKRRDFEKVYSELCDNFKGFYTKKADERVKSKFPKLKKLTYKGMVKDYFGVEIDTNSEMKLSKQLSKKGVAFTNKEIAHFGEVKKWFECVDNHRFSSLDCFSDAYFTMGKLYVDTEDFTIPDFVDNWAFNSSCNISHSSTGRSTHLWLKELNFSYLKIYGLSRSLTQGKTELLPFARAYFYQDKEGNIGHSGGYSDIYAKENREGTTAYEFWTTLLCILFKKKIDDFIWGIDGINMTTGDYTNWNNQWLYIYANTQGNTGYTKIGTNSGIFTNIGDNKYLKKKTVLMDETGYLSGKVTREYTELSLKELNLYGE